MTTDHRKLLLAWVPAAAVAARGLDDYDEEPDEELRQLDDE